MTPAEKKRLTWLLLLIFFFFANLTLVSIILIRSLSMPPHTSSTAQTAPAAQ